MRGVVEDVWYRCDRHEDGTCAVTKGRVAQLELGAVAHVNDEIAWHTFANPGRERAVTLHFYSPPIDSCQYYDAETRTTKTRTLTYFSKEGVVS